MRNASLHALGALLLLVGCADVDRGLESAGPTPEGGFDMSGGRSGGGAGEIEPGTLTAGAWDDNRNFERYLAFLDESADVALPFEGDELVAANERFAGERAPNRTLDVALVIDTTGSMSDEIRYLQTELDAIAASVDAAYPDADARWALIVYRDETDDYVTRVFDFRDVDALRSDLADQGAAGGGDYPEASHAALTDMTNLDWRDDADTARLAFWVADAPHHEGHTGALTEAIRTASSLDVHVYPVASSGVNLRTEASMRTAAQVTGGRYLFLTDDSGVGGSHLEPSVPCYFVTLLSDAMTRMVDIEMTGVYREPAPDRVLRTGGDPSDGACTLDDGEIVRIF